MGADNVQETDVGKNARPALLCRIDHLVLGRL